MVQVSYPGVYIQEVSSGVHTITGVSTSIAAFIGRASNGPVDKAVRCLSMADFTRTFGDAHSRNRLAQSVRQFFDNGGTDCYIVRLAPGAGKAEITLKDITNEKNVLVAKAKYEGKWGNGLYLEIDYNTPLPDETFNLRVTYEDRGTTKAEEVFYSLSMDENSPRFAPSFVSQSSSLISLERPGSLQSSISEGYSQSLRPLNTENPEEQNNGLKTVLNGLIYPQDETKAKCAFTIRVNDGELIDIDLREGYSEFSGDKDAIIKDLADRINSKLGSKYRIECRFEPVDNGLGSDGKYRFLRIVSVSDSESSVRVQRGPVKDIAGPLMLGIDQGGIEIVKGSDLRPVPTGIYYSGDVETLSFLSQSETNTIKIANKDVPLASSILVTSEDQNSWYIDRKIDPAAYPLSGNFDGVRKKLGIIVSEINNNTALPFRAELSGYRLRFRPIKGLPDAVITVDEMTLGTDVKDKFTSNVFKYQLGNTGSGTYFDLGKLGKDETRIPNPEDYFGNEIDQTGMHALDSADIFNLMVIPEDEDISDENEFLRIYSEASNYCKEKRAFLVMNTPVSWTNKDTNRPKATQTEINMFRAQVSKEYSAVFYPQIKYVESGIKKSMGPSGMIAGLIARIDSTRGVWKAPAGIEATLTGVVDLQVNLTDRENGVYNKLGVNCLRIFPNGFVNWGARTMAGFDDNSETEWKYIPIRRLALFIEESLYRGTKWVVFEPNDEPLWAKIRLNIGAFMMSLFREGAFQGTTPDKAFYVKCDRETTTQDDRNKGIVNIEVGFAPLKPAEFVVIKIQQMAGEL